MARSRIESREVEVDGELTIELLADGVVRAELRWIELPPSARAEPGWGLHGAAPPGTADAAHVAHGVGAMPSLATWSWDSDDERELAHLVDALRDHRRERTARNEMRVRFWERRARDASAVGAAAWGRERLAAQLGTPLVP